MIDTLAPMARSEFDPPWVDLQFALVTVQSTGDQSHLVLECEGAADSLPVGFGLSLERTGWVHDGVEGEDRIWSDWGRCEIFSTGAASDRLAGLLARLFGHEGPRSFVERLPCDIVLLTSDPTRLDSSYCRTKLFVGEADDEEGQVFINFDVPNRRVELREKDPDFRLALLRELTVQ